MWRKQKEIELEVVSNRKALIQGLRDPESITWIKNKTMTEKDRLFLFLLSWCLNKFVKNKFERKCLV